MSDLPPRPPAPNQAAGQKPQQEPERPETAERPPPPGRQTKESKEKKEKQPQDKEKKKKGFAKQIKPTIIMAILLAAVTLGYLAVRAGREALSPPDPKALTLPADLGYLSLEVPAGWSHARMGDVEGASGRWAIGPEGAREYALFITRYRLKKNPDGEEGEKAMLAEAEASLSLTGGPGKPRPAAEEKVGGQKAFRYAFKKGAMWIDIWLTLHRKDQKAALYQFSCQSRPAGKGEKMRERCAEILNSVRFSDKAP